MPGATAVVKAVAACQGKPGVCGQRFDYSGIQSCAARGAARRPQGLRVQPSAWARLRKGS